MCRSRCLEPWRAFPLFLAGMMAACARPAAEQAPAPQEPPAAVELVDVAAASGLHFRHETGAFGLKYLPETMGSGCAFLDYDGDGRDDVLLLSAGNASGVRLFKNDGTTHFTEVTAHAGLTAAAHAMGVAAADADNDGDVDVLVTCLGPDLFFENDGRGAFRERARELGLADEGFGTSAAWLDANEDGFLDLVVGNYVKWSSETDIHCSLDGRRKSYCTPESYTAERCRFYIGGPGLSFRDRSAQSGISVPPAKALGIATADFDVDGHMDVAVANDTQPNLLFAGRGDGTFEERGLPAGIAFSETGVARGATGIAAADYDGSGRPSLLIGNVSNQMLSLHHNEGEGRFHDVAPASAIGRTSLLTMAFGCSFVDVNADAALDLFVGNGHVEPDIASIQKDVTYAALPHLYVNDGAGNFRLATSEAGRSFARPIVARGAACGDPDGDGDPDILVTTSGGPALLFQNRLDRPLRSLWIELEGTRSNRDGIGAVVRLAVDGRSRTHFVTGGGSYLSQSSRLLHLGLGEGAVAQDVTVTWPSGVADRLGTLEGGRRYRVVEGTGKGIRR